MCILYLLLYFILFYLLYFIFNNEHVFLGFSAEYVISLIPTKTAQSITMFERLNDCNHRDFSSLYCYLADMQLLTDGNYEKHKTVLWFTCIIRFDHLSYFVQ